MNNLSDESKNSSSSTFKLIKNSWKLKNRVNYTPYPINIPDSTLTSLSSYQHDSTNSQLISDTKSNTTNLNIKPIQSATNATTISQTNPLSDYEKKMLSSKTPLDLPKVIETIEVEGERGLWVNKSETVNWKGDLPISEYKINVDTNPEIILKKSTKTIDYKQECVIRYLRPPTPPSPGEIIIRQEKNIISKPAPPIVIRQEAARLKTPEPLVIREVPPVAPEPIGRKLITISGKKLPPPPRKVIVERLPKMPRKPASVLIERWLPYTQVKRKVIFKPAPSTPIIPKPKNVIVQWNMPEVKISKRVKYLGISKTNPIEYVQKYGPVIMEPNDLPDLVNYIKTPNGIVLAADNQKAKINKHPLLEGDVNALNLIDLKKENLGEYKKALDAFNQTIEKKNNLKKIDPASVKSNKYRDEYEPSSLLSTTLGINTEDLISEAKYFSSISPSGFSNQEPRSASTPHNISETTMSSDIDAEKLISLVFQMVDTNNNGTITFEDARHVFTRLNKRLNRKFDDSDMKSLFNLRNSNNEDQTISYDNFKNAFTENFFKNV